MFLVFMKKSTSLTMNSIVVLVLYAALLQSSCTAWMTRITTTTRLGARVPFSYSSTSARVSSTLEEHLPMASDNENDDPNYPELGPDGIYRINNKAEHQAFLRAHPDQLIVLKVFAPWCRACKGLEPKFQQMASDPKYSHDLPLKFAQLSIQHNKDFVKSIGVLALPTIQFYVGGALHDNFPCGPSKLPILKRKLAALVKDHVDANTRQVKDTSIDYYQTQLANGISFDTSSMSISEDETTMTPSTTSSTSSTTGIDSTAQSSLPPPMPRRIVPTPNVTEAVGASAITDSALPPSPTVAERRRILDSIPWFAQMSLADADAVLDKARLLTFEPKSIIMREGKTGRTFYIIKTGDVEILQATAFPYDPLIVPSSYLGTVINRLGAGDYFGERALMTGEPRAATIRADTRVSCWAIDKDDFPFSSALSGRTRGTAYEDELLDNVNDKYGVSLDAMYQEEVAAAVRQATTASQIRGSVNKPAPIRGVDTDDEVDEEDYDYGPLHSVISPASSKLETKDAIFSVLRRFQLIRQVSKCFDYIVQTRAQWGTAGIRKRREFLVNRLSESQRADFRETFRLIDASGDGRISLLELQRVMDSIGEPKTDEELHQVMANASLDGTQEMNMQDFTGLMAEAEFYNLFRDIFATLDTQNSGFVKAGDLDRTLQGVRDLISDDRKSLIDVEDSDVLIDYERFSRMLLGTALI